MRKLESHDLGDKGEAYFKQISVDARLIAHKVTRDLTGWDYLVEEKGFSTEHPSLDARPSPMNYKFQVKTKWRNNRQVQVRLSAAERLAKDPDPAFIYVIRAETDGTFHEAQIIHVEGAFLELILKRLRQAQAASEKVNKINLSFQLDAYGASLPATGAALRAHLTAQCGINRADYSAGKRKQLESAGFGKRPFKANTTFAPVTNQELVDGFLGLHKLDIKSMTSVEERFGIPLPMPNLPSGPASMEFQPQAIDTCVVSVRRSGGEPAIKFKAKMFAPPWQLLPNSKLVMLIRSDLFRLKIDADGLGTTGPTTISVTFNAEEEAVEAGLHKPMEWLNFFDFAAMMREGSLKLSVQPKKMPSWQGNPSTPRSDVADDAIAWRDVCTRTEEIFRRASAPGSKVRVGEIERASHDTWVVHNLIHRPETMRPLSFETELFPREGNDHDRSMLFFQGFWVGSNLFIYALKLTIRPEFSATVRWSSVAASFVAIEKVRYGQTDVDAFVRAMETETAVSDWIISSEAWAGGFEQRHDDTRAEEGSD